MPKIDTKNDTDIIDARLRDNLVRIRKAAGLSQSRLAELSGIRHIGQIEAGSAGMGKQVVTRLAAALEVDVSEFYQPPAESRDKTRRLQQASSLLSSAAQGLLFDIIRAIIRFEAKR
jgi:transcriptional regulator with XRE-family HTH domain